MSFIKDKVALVTGGASGIGLCCAKELLKNGLKALTIADTNVSNGEAAVRSITSEFGPDRVIFIKTDITNDSDVEDAFEQTVKAFKNLDIVINSAGILDERDWEREIAVNLNGTVKMCLQALEKYLPKYRSGNEGVIINISSTAGLEEYGPMPVYVASKHGVIGLTRSLAAKEHYDRTKVRVIAVCPGLTDTGLIGKFSDRTLGPGYRQILEKGLPNVTRQRPESVAKGVVQAINEGGTGSIWMVIEDEISKIRIPSLSTLLQESKD